MKKTFALLVLAAIAGTAFAGEMYDVTFPDTIDVEGQTLLLNGMGLRKKAFIKVYIAGLYLPEKTTDAAAILAADTPRRTVMHFKFGVSGERMCSAWEEGLEANTPGASAATAAKFGTLCSAMDDVGNGDTMVMTYVPGKGTQIEVKGVDKGTIEGKEFADALFACWIGPEPPGAAFKEGLLGG